MKLKPSKYITKTAANEDAGGDCFVLGGGHLGAAIARRLQAAGLDVVLIDDRHEPGDVPGRQGDPGDTTVLSDAGIADASRVIVATERDSRNLLIAQLVDARFDVDEVVVLVHVPERHDVVVETGHDTVCATTALSEAVVGTIEGASAEEDATR